MLYCQCHNIIKTQQMKNVTLLVHAKGTRTQKPETSSSAFCLDICVQNPIYSGLCDTSWFPPKSTTSRQRTQARAYRLQYPQFRLVAGQRMIRIRFVKPRSSLLRSINFNSPNTFKHSIKVINFTKFPVF